VPLKTEENIDFEKIHNNVLLDVKNGQGYYKFLSYLNDLLGRQSQPIADKRYFSKGKEKGRDKIAALIV